MATVRARPGGRVVHSSTGASAQIAAQMRIWLEQQQLEAGERIGTEQELADEFGVSRPTMREALRLLSAAHLIRVGRVRAGGIFVARTPSEGMSRNLSESIALMLAAQSRRSLPTSPPASTPRRSSTSTGRSCARSAAASGSRRNAR